MERQLNSTICKLYESGTGTTLAGFRGWALTLLNEQVPFSHAAWGSGCTIANRLHDLHLVRDAQPAMADTDPANTTLSELYANGAGAHGSVVAVGSRLQISVLDEVSGLHNFLSVGRQEQGAAFSTGDLERLSLLAPHLFGAWRNCQQLNLHVRCVTESGKAIAMTDAHGYMRATDNRFLPLLRQHWPDWHGQRLPDELHNLLRDGGESTVGVVRWYVKPMGQYRYLAGLPLGLLARLTEREAMIARSITDGLTYEESAGVHGISVHTVRNVMARIYRKLDVGNRVELVRRLAKS